MNIAHATIKGAIRAFSATVMERGGGGLSPVREEGTQEARRQARGHYCTCTVRFVNTALVHATL
ncbi:hypothetical protein [Paraburkholderia phenoliruptrix]|nr:hypothetical protein [Paraburkholderia phenoliruptrix]